MSDKQKSKTGSSFKVPGSRGMKQRAKASTPTTEENEVPLGCDISAIEPRNPVAQRGKHTAAPNVKKALYKSGLEKSVQVPSDKSVQVPSDKMTKEAKQMELDMAYNTYLLAITHKSMQEKIYADTKTQIEADLGALAKRLADNQLNLETTKQRIAEITSLSERTRLIEAQKEALSETLDHVEGATAERISAISAAVDEKTAHLEMKNIKMGTAELKQILADSTRMLDQLKASNLGVDDRALTAAQQFSSVAATAQILSARQERVAKLVPAYQGAAISKHAIRNFEAEDRENEERKRQEEEEEKEEDDSEKTFDIPDDYCGAI